jgi:hypothetical protein
MPADSRATVARKRSARSKISNGKVLVGGIDGRSAGARRLHDIIADLEADLGGDLGEAERLQVRTAAGLVLHSERLTADMLNGKPVDSEQVTRTANSAARLLGALRAKRKPKAGPSLADYLASKRAAEVAA